MLKYFYLFFVVALTACTPGLHDAVGSQSQHSLNSSANSENNQSSTTFKLFPGTLEGVGLHTENKNPKGVRSLFSPKWTETQEPSLLERIGTKYNDANLADVCSGITAEYTIVDCKIVNAATSHIEFYFADEFAGNFHSFGKAALFKTQSQWLPNAIFYLPQEPEEDKHPTSVAEAEEYLNELVVKSVSDPKIQEFDVFVRSIQSQPLKEPEPQWLLYTNSTLGFSFEYPAGMFAHAPFEGASAVSVSGIYYIEFFSKDDRDTLEMQIHNTGNQYDNRSEKRVNVKVGTYDAEQIIIHPLDDFGQLRYVISGENGYFYFSLHTDNEEELLDYANHLLSTFRISE